MIRNEKGELKTVEELVKHCMEIGKKMDEAKELLFQSKGDTEYIIQVVDFENWMVVAQTHNEWCANMIRDAFVAKGYTARIMYEKTIKKFGEEVEPPKPPPQITIS